MSSLQGKVTKKAEMVLGTVFVHAENGTESNAQNCHFCSRSVLYARKSGFGISASPL
jgi:hypothetical protein